MSATDDLLAQRRPRVRGELRQGRAAAPARQGGRRRRLHGRAPRSRQKVLGLGEGDAHVIRNAGGVVTDDEIRSLAISQRLLGTDGDHPHPPHGLRDAHLHRRRVQALSSRRRPASSPSGRPRRSPTSTRTSASRSRRIQASPFIPHKDSVRGFVYDVETGRLREVDAEAGAVALPARARRGARHELRSVSRATAASRSPGRGRAAPRA